MTPLRSSILRALSMLLALVAATIAIRYWHDRPMIQWRDDIVILVAFALTAGAGIMIEWRNHVRRNQG